jgi:integrase
VAKRPLLAPSDIGRLLAACRPGVTQNAALMSCYLRFLALTGSREREALAVRWQDVDFKNAQVTVGADGTAKNARHRSINFSQELGALLAEMHADRPPDSQFLFPSPQRRGAEDTPARSLRGSLHRVRTAAGLPRIAFHDFRHFFASQCVMAGIDFMTIASWLGHQDGGVLVGKIYGHLTDRHRERMANSLSILNAPV